MHDSNNLDDICWLTGSEAAALLSEVAGWRGELTTKLRRLRGQVSATRANLVLQQIEYRWRARTKFSASERMFFTKTGLEQATDEVVSGYKATRFVGREQLFDLCTGIGGDLLSLAHQCPTTGIDRDPVTLKFAEANSRLVEHARVTLINEDVKQVDVSQCDAWHIDPDRRPHGRRTTHVEFHEPSADSIEELFLRNPNAAVKLAPAATWPAAWNAKAEWEWISRGRECRQLVAWFGNLTAHPGTHRATVLGKSPSEFCTFVGVPGHDVPVASRIDRYLFEPDAAVLAAGLAEPLANAHNLQAISARIAYWTGPEAISNPLLSCFEVDAVIPFDMKKLKALIRHRDTRLAEIKVRGAKHDPAELQRRLSSAGSNPGTLFVTPAGEQFVAILARRLSSQIFK